MSKLPQNACRLRVRYVKEGRLAHLGHLEVMGTVIHSIRRAGLPFEVSNGFARRMRIQFSQALPVGAASVAEYYDLLLSEPIDASEALAKVKDATPSLLAPQQAAILPRRMPALEAWADRALWDIVVSGSQLNAELCSNELRRVESEGVIHFMRGDKPRSLELARTLVSYDVRQQGEDVRIKLDTRVTERGSLRPAVLINAALGCDPRSVCRLGQWHEEEDGSLVCPL